MKFQKMGVMKRNTSILGRWLSASVISLVMFSCSHDSGSNALQVTDRNPISFEAYVNQAVSRAPQADITNSSLSKFNVYATGNTSLYFSDETFLKDGITSNWKTAVPFYWPSYALSFYAYTPASGSGTITNCIIDGSKSDDDQSIGISVSTDLSQSEDIVTAYVPATADPKIDDPTKQAVGIVFKHCLSRVEIKASNQSPVYTVKVYGAKIANLADTGTYNFKTAAMTVQKSLINSKTSTDFVSALTSPVTLDTTAVNVLDAGTGRWYLMPQTCVAWDMTGGNNNNGTYLALKVMITSSGGAKVYPPSGNDPMWIAVPKPADLKFEMGRRYSVTFNFFANDGAGYQDPEQDKPVIPGPGNPIFKSDKPISFSSTYNNWDAVENISINL